MIDITCTCGDIKPDGWPRTHVHSCNVVRIPILKKWFHHYHGMDQYCPCDKCADREECEYAYDIYNNDDDCLGIK